MSFRPLPLASLAIALSAWGCGGDAHEEAPALATAAAIAKAAPNATGADVGRPAAPSLNTLKGPTPIKKGGPGLAEPAVPSPPPPSPGTGGAPPKGTDL